MAGNNTVGGCSGGTVNVTKTTGLATDNGTFSFTGGLGPFDITTVGGTGTKTFTDVPPGPLSIAEIAPSGWTLGTNGCASVTVPAGGGSVSCTVTNTKDTAPPGTIQVHTLKYLNGAKATAASAGGYMFPMVATSAFLAFTNSPYVLGNNFGGAPDLYGADTLPMSIGADYTTSEVTGSVSLVLPTGSACVPGNFVLLGYSTSAVSLADAALRPITTGAPNFANLQTDEYIIVWNRDCATNGALNVTKTSVGGVGTFAFTGGPTGPFTITTTVPGTPVTVTFSNIGPGPYTITETGPSGWTATYNNCTLVTVPAGGAATCAVVNTAVTIPPGALQVIKTTGNTRNNGTFTFAGPNGIFTITTTNGTGTVTIPSLAPGQYTVTETGLPAGWVQTSSTCSSVAVPAGLTATCMVVNAAVTSPPGALKVIKTTGSTRDNGTFTFTGPSGVFTIKTTNGTGTVTIPNLPPGKYTVTETGLPVGWVQASSTCSLVTVATGLTASCTVANAKVPVCETTAPAVSVVSIAPGPPVVVTLKVQDAGGLQSIVVIVNTNAKVVVPAFAPGTTSPVYVTATKINQSQGSAVGLRVTDLCGNVTIFDPVTVTVNPGRHEAVMLTGVPEDETLVKIINDGLDAMKITVNGRLMPVIQMRPRETRIVDISRAMLPGDDNTIVLEARGPNNGSAVVTVYPPPAASPQQEQARREHRNLSHKMATVIVLR